MSRAEIIIQPFASVQHMHVCEQLQRSVWQYADLEIVPYSMFVVAHRVGGEVLGAFDGDRAVGFSLALPGLRLPRFYLHSHMTAVLPEYQNQGVGRSLKLAQRDNAIARGIELIEWTFDPLQIGNAHFNIARLGAVVRKYLPDFYGPTSSNLQGGLRTDRLVAEWWLNSNRVQSRLRGSPLSFEGKQERISIPADIREICCSDPRRADEIQSRIRDQFRQRFQHSYAVTGFAIENGCGSYQLEIYEN